MTTDVTGASLKEIFGEIDRLQREPPRRSELTGIQNYMAGLFVAPQRSRAGIIGSSGTWTCKGCRDLAQRLREARDGRHARTSAATSPDVPQCDDRTTIVVVGDRKVVEEQVAPFTPPTP